MRPRTGNIACCWSLACAVLLAAQITAQISAQEQETFPYTATVTAMNVTARSGPSYGDYPTEKLAKQARVEVYREEAGWGAIRPPREAFDWLPASAVQREGNATTAEIISDDLEAHIGSNVKRVERHTSQVKLKAGETVQILAEKQVQRGDGEPETWLKIAPPAGEFRWVQLKHLSRKSPEELESEAAQELAAREERYREENAAEPPGLLSKTLLASRAIGSGLKKVEPDPAEETKKEEVSTAQFLRRGTKPLLRKANPIAPPASESTPSLEIDMGSAGETLRTDDAAPVVEDTSSGASSPRSKISLDPQALKTPPNVKPSFEPKPRPTPTLVEREPPRDVPSTTSELPLASAPPSVAKAPTRPLLEPGDFKELLAQLEVDLTVMVAEESTQWSMKPLRQRAEALVEDGPTPVDRGRARLLLDRIAEFEATLPARQQEAIPSTVVSDATAIAAKPGFEVQYDAVGYLMPVLGARPGTPPYQLTDKDGHTLQYVSAAPGVNLNRFVKKQVGLYGQRGYVETLKKQHVLAEKVIDLDRHKR